MSATEPAGLQRSPEAEKIEKRLKKKAEVEEAAILEDAGAIAATARLDQTLVLVESAGFRLVEEEEELEVGLTAKDIAKVASEARTSFNDGFQIVSRGLAAWAVRKIVEAKTRLEDVRVAFRAEVRRCEREHEGRREFFEEKIKAWAMTQPIEKGTKGTVRLPEAGVRLELRDDQAGGVRVIDERVLIEEIIAREGIFVAIDRGLIRQTYVLQESAAKDYLAFLGDQVSWRGAEVLPLEPTKKLVIVRVAR